MAMLGAMLSKDLGQRGNRPAHGGRAAGYACPHRTCPALPGLRQAHDHEPAVRQHLRPGRGLVCRLFPLRGFPSTAWKRKGGLSELGVGGNTPVIIKYPFWKMTYQNAKAFYVCVNLSESCCPKEIQKRSICLNRDIGTALHELYLQM